MSRVLLILLLLLIAVDVIGNVLVAGGTWRHTLSASAWKNRGHRFFGWCHRVIDRMPWWGAGHCQGQYERELQFGSVWAAWHDNFKKA